MEKSIQERIELAQKLMDANSLKLKPLKENSLKNKVFGTSCTGYTFGINTLSYRGSWVSTIEDLELVVDGERVSKSDMLFCVNGIKIPIDNLGEHTEIFWGAMDDGIINVNKIGGLSKGEHKIEITIKKRGDFGHSYGEGAEGYEDAIEFLNPAIIKDETVCVIP